MLILIRFLPLLTLYILFFFFEFKIVMIGYVSACIIQLLSYKILTRKFSFPYFLYFFSGLFFTSLAIYFEQNTIFMYEISFLLIISALYILYKHFRAKEGILYIMGISQPLEKRLNSLRYLNYFMSAVYGGLAVANIAIIHYLSPVYWINFRVIGVYLILTLISGIVGFSLSTTESRESHIT